MAKTHRPSRSRPRTKPSQQQPPEPEGSAALLTFRVARKLAADSTIAQLTEGALNVEGENDLYSNIEAVHDTLEREYQARGSTGLSSIEDVPAHLANDRRDPHAALLNLTTSCAESGYLYGLAIGLQLGRGGAR